MRRFVLVGASALALAAASIHLLRREPGGNLPPAMNKEGEGDDGDVIVRRRTVDYESIVRRALTEQTSLIVMTLKDDVVRDRHLATSIRYTPFPSSRARVRVKYHVEYPVGFDLGPGDFSVAREGGDLVVRVGRPKLVARPSVRLTGYEVLERGFLIDEEAAVAELQQLIQPETERRGRRLLARPAVSARGERVLRRFLTDLTGKVAQPGDDPPPPIVIRYR